MTVQKNLSNTANIHTIVENLSFLDKLYYQWSISLVTFLCMYDEKQSKIKHCIMTRGLYHDEIRLMRWDEHNMFHTSKNFVFCKHFIGTMEGFSILCECMGMSEGNDRKLLSLNLIHRRNIFNKQASDILKIWVEFFYLHLIRSSTAVDEYFIPQLCSVKRLQSNRMRRRAYRWYIPLFPTFSTFITISYGPVG